MGRRELVAVWVTGSTIWDGEARLLERALGALAERIEHIGSTAVPGMWAKPIIDILVGWTPPGDLERARRLLGLQYDYVGEDGRRPGRFMFHKRAGQCVQHQHRSD